MSDSAVFRLDSQQVADTFNACIADGDEGFEVDMIVSKIRLDKERLANHAELIAAMLLELPDQFRKSGGGGWSFLNACDDKHGNQWTGLHLRMSELFAMGQGIGMVECQLPRELWDALPGGMPYYIINDQLGPRRIRRQMEPDTSSTGWGLPPEAGE
jgi:hypothetical protein